MWQFWYVMLYKPAAAQFNVIYYNLKIIYEFKGFMDR